MGRIVLNYKDNEMFDSEFKVRESNIKALISQLENNIYQEAEKLKRNRENQISLKLAAETWLVENSSKIESAIKNAIVDIFNSNYTITDNGKERKIRVSDLVKICYCSSASVLIIICEIIYSETYSVKLNILSMTSKEFSFECSSSMGREEITLTFYIPGEIEGLSKLELVKLFTKGFTSIEKLSF